MNINPSSIPEDSVLPAGSALPVRSWTSRVLGWVGGANQNKSVRQLPDILVQEQRLGNTPVQTPEKARNRAEQQVDATSHLNRADVSLASSEISSIRFVFVETFNSILI
jgi:hypothetical protein